MRHKTSYIYLCLLNTVTIKVINNAIYFCQVQQEKLSCMISYNISHILPWAPLIDSAGRVGCLCSFISAGETQERHVNFSCWFSVMESPLKVVPNAIKRDKFSPYFPQTENGDD